MKRTKKILAMLLCAVLLVTGTVAVTVAYLTSTTDVVTNTFTVGKVAIDLDEAKVNEYGELLDTEGKVYEGKEGQGLAARVKENTYKLLPGHAYVKDPTVTVKAKSEDSYVRIQVSVSDADMTQLKLAFPAEEYSEWYVNETAGNNKNEENVFLLQNLVAGWDNSVWEYKFYDVITESSTDDAGMAVTTTTHTYEFWYFGDKADENGVVPYTEDANGTVLEPLFEQVVVPAEMNNAAIAYLNNVEINIIAYAIQADGFADADAAWAAFEE